MLDSKSSFGIRCAAASLIFFALASATFAQRRPRVPTVLAGRAFVSASPATKVWEYIPADGVRFAPVASLQAVYVALLNGQVVALGARDGNLLWETSPGAPLTAPLKRLSDNSLLTCAARGQGDAAEGVVRILDATTGITQRTAVTPQPITSDVIEHGPTFLARLGDRTLAALNRADLAVRWTVKSESALADGALADGDVIFVGDAAGAVRALQIGDGAKLWESNVGAKIGALAGDERRIYFGSSDGLIHALDRRTGREVWRRRTGAAIEAAPVIVGERALVSSFDNFLYACKTKNGAVDWRQQMAGRLQFPLLAVSDESFAVAAFDSDEVTVVQNQDGRIAARLLVAPARIAAPPSLVGGLLIVPSEQGVAAVRFVGR
jgi:outer membrane protein assembly factor BamB